VAKQGLKADHKIENDSLFVLFEPALCSPSFPEGKRSQATGGKGVECARRLPIF